MNKIQYKIIHLKYFMESLERNQLICDFEIERAHTLIEQLKYDNQRAVFAKYFTSLQNRISERDELFMNRQFVGFSNYLIEKFNHRIKRNDAAEKKIVEYLFQGSEHSTFQQFYGDFLHS